MAKKSQKLMPENTETQVSANVTPAGINHVKAIKNSLFKDLPIGESVTVGGIIRSVSSKDGQFGTYEEFKGDFGCVNGDKVYRGTKLFLPGVAADVLKNQFLEAVEASGLADTTKVKVEFKIRLVKLPDDSPKNNSKFQWSFENLMETAPESDKVLALLQ